MIRILIVDDNEELRSLMATLLKRDGYEVSLSANGAEALKVHSKATFDVLITDIFMPEKDGIETIDEFHAKHPRTRIIAMSGIATNSMDYLSLALEIGAHKALKKPFDVAALKMALKEVLAKPRLRSKTRQSAVAMKEPAAG